MFGSRTSRCPVVVVDLVRVFFWPFYRSTLWSRLRRRSDGVERCGTMCFDPNSNAKKPGGRGDSACCGGCAMLATRNSALAGSLTETETGGPSAGPCFAVKKNGFLLRFPAHCREVQTTGHREMINAIESKQRRPLRPPFVEPGGTGTTSEEQVECRAIGDRIWVRFFGEKLNRHHLVSPPGDLQCDPVVSGFLAFVLLDRRRMPDHGNGKRRAIDRSDRLDVVVADAGFESSTIEGTTAWPGHAHCSTSLSCN